MIYAALVDWRLSVGVLFGGLGADLARLVVGRSWC